MAGKGGKGLLAGKTTAAAAAAAAAANKDKDKKRPVSRSSRAGLQVKHLFLFCLFLLYDFVFVISWINLIANANSITLLGMI